MMKFDQAIRNYDEAIKLNPKYAEAFNNRGVALAARRGSNGGGGNTTKQLS